MFFLRLVIGSRRDCDQKPRSRFRRLNISSFFLPLVSFLIALVFFFFSFLFLFLFVSLTRSLAGFSFIFLFPALDEAEQGEPYSKPWLCRLIRDGPETFFFFIFL